MSATMGLGNWRHVTLHASLPSLVLGFISVAYIFLLSGLRLSRQWTQVYQPSDVPVDETPVPGALRLGEAAEG